MEGHPCPVCGSRTHFNPRYPRAVCGDCAAKTTDASGRSVQFFNESLGGGLMGLYGDGTNYPEVRCWIEGIPCIASEARFGGVVVEIVPGN